MHSLGEEDPACLQEMANSLAGEGRGAGGARLTSSLFFSDQTQDNFLSDQTQLIVHTCQSDIASELITTTCSHSAPKYVILLLPKTSSYFLNPG